MWFGEHAHRARTRAAARLVLERAPTFVALQEVTRASLSWLLEDLGDAYLSSDTDGSTFDEYGTLLLARVRPESLWLAELPTSMGRSMPYGVFSIAGARLAVGAVHLESHRHNGETREDQLRECFARLASFEHAVLMGDFNFADREPEEQSIPSAFRDAWKQTHGPSEPGFTRDTATNAMARAARDNAVRRRIDRVLLRSPTLTATASKLEGAAPIDASGALYVSDHFGVSVEIAPR
ncbi:MAG: endonuclease/exonuclease/phosphatase family protein [Myxococcales bacterium]|nr:endonuclease/exonuclease/phosphatase family protein [Myxococcales bacterium]